MGISIWIKFIIGMSYVYYVIINRTHHRDRARTGVNIKINRIEYQDGNWMNLMQILLSFVYFFLFAYLNILVGTKSNFQQKELIIEFVW